MSELVFGIVQDITIGMIAVGVIALGWMVKQLLFPTQDEDE